MREINGEKRERNQVLVSFHGTVAWFEDRTEKRQAVPRLYYDGNRSLVCAGRWAFRVGKLFDSEYQARLWCHYHGFEFTLGDVWLAPDARFFSQRPELLRFRLRPEGDFRVEAYESHRSVCPDCQRRASAALFNPALG